MRKGYEVITTQPGSRKVTGHGPFDTKEEAERYAARCKKGKRGYDLVEVRPASHLTDPPQALARLFRF